MLHILRHLGRAMEFFKKLGWEMYYWAYTRPTAEDIQSTLVELQKREASTLTEVPAGELCDCLVTIGLRTVSCTTTTKSACRNVGQPGSGAVGHIYPVGACKGLSER
jgi:hypothetical protein